VYLKNLVSTNTTLAFIFLADVCLENQAVEPDKPLEEIRQEEYSLPSGFEWDTINIDDPKQVMDNKVGQYRKLPKIQSI
jgi:hypothetical protein